MASPAAAPLPPGWAEFVDPQGRNYYAHSPTQTVSWDRPIAAPPPPPPPPAASAPPAHMVLSGHAGDESVMSDKLLTHGVRSDMMPPEAAHSQASSQVQTDPPKWSSGVFDCVRPVFDPDTQVGLCFTSSCFPFLTQGSAYSKMGLSQYRKDLTSLFCLGWCENCTGIGRGAYAAIASAAQAGAQIPIGCYLIQSCNVALIQSCQATIAASSSAVPVGSF